MKFIKRSERSASGAPPGDSPGAEAVRWLARLELGLLQRDEEAAFGRWREKSENEAALTDLRAMLNRVQSTASDPDVVRMRAETLSRPRRGPLLLGNVPAGVAAAVLVAVLLVTVVWQKSDHSTVATAPATHSTQVYATQKGEQQAITLDDGSVLTLNTESRAEVVLSVQERSIRLVRGQAFFQVAKDKDRPFTVMAGPLEVRALGTQFDVRIDREGAKVVLIEGRVQVEPLIHQGIAKILPMWDRHYLKPGQQLVADRRDDMAIVTADVEQATSWQQGRLVFRGERLESAVAEFNRYNQRQLAIEDPALGRLPVSGVFSTSRPENFLVAVASFYPVDIEDRSPELAVLRLKNNLGNK